MAQPPPPSGPFDPYKHFRFRLWFEGRCVAGIHRVGTFKRISEPVGAAQLESAAPPPSFASRPLDDRPLPARPVDARPLPARSLGDQPSGSFPAPARAYRTRYAPITLERGITHDVAFTRWASRVCEYAAGVGNELSLLDFRRDLTLELYNEAGRPSASYQLLRCWISVFQTLPELDASPTARSILRLQLENEGWILDEAPLPPRAADRP